MMASIIRFFFFFFQAEDGIRDLVRSRGLGDVYKRQHPAPVFNGENKLPVKGMTHCASVISLDT